MNQTERMRLDLHRTKLQHTYARARYMAAVIARLEGGGDAREERRAKAAVWRTQKHASNARRRYMHARYGVVMNTATVATALAHPPTAGGGKGEA